MKKMLALIIAIVTLITIAAAIAQDATYTNYLLSGGINGKKNTAKVKKEVTGSARNVVTYISRTLSNTDPVITKVRRASDGAPVTSAHEVIATGTYYLGYGSNYGQTNIKYYMKMQNTTGSPDVTISGTFTP